jgi:hypothetical protein
MPKRKSLLFITAREEGSIERIFYQLLIYFRAILSSDTSYEVVEEFAGPHWSGFGEIASARSTNVRHHSGSHVTYFLIKRRNHYEPIRARH